MYSSYFPLFALLFLKTISFAEMFNNIEDLITINFINAYGIKYCIYAKNYKNEGTDLKNLKKFSAQTISVNVFNYNELEAYWETGNFPYVKKMIVVKNGNMSLLIKHFQNLKDHHLEHQTGHFIWLVFVKFDENLENDLEYLLVPYSCQFIISYPINGSIYKFLEVYKVKNKTFQTELGGFYNNHITLNHDYLYLRRKDLNGTALEATANDLNELEWLKVVGREKRQLEILDDIAKIMNFKYTYRQINRSDSIYELHGDLYTFQVPYHSVGYLPDFAGPLFKSTINWYITTPKYEVTSDFYIKPFNDYLWACILGFITFGSFCGVLIKIILNALAISDTVSILDLFFLGFESFCNQIGCADDVKKTSLRLLCISFRLTALYLIPSYCSIITSFLTVKIMDIPFTNFKEFVKNGKYTLAIFEHSFLDDYLKTSTDVTLRQIYANYSRVFPGLSPPPEYHEKFCEGKLAYTFLDDDLRSDYWKEFHNCEIYKIQNPITFFFTGILLGTNSPFNEVFNYYVTRFYTSGIINELQKLTEEDTTLLSQPNDDFKPVDIDQMVQVFAIIGIGSVLAGIILLIEFCVKKKWCCSENPKFCLE